MYSLRNIAAVGLAASAIDPLIEHLSTLVEIDPRPGSKAHYRLRQVYDIITPQAFASASDNSIATASTSPSLMDTSASSHSRSDYHSSATPSSLPCSSSPSCVPAVPAASTSRSSTSDMSLAVNAHLLGQLTAMMTAMRSCRSVGRC